jgi:hypothetical protein
MDADQSGNLNQDEFCNVMMLLFSNVLFRVMVQWSMTLLIVPLIAQALLDFMYAIGNVTYSIIVNLDEYSHVANYIELTVEAVGEALLDQMPSFVLKTSAKAGHYLRAIPDAVWNSIPLTLLSTILGMLVVPYLILQVDDFFQHLAATTSAAAASTHGSGNGARQQQTPTRTSTTTKKS